MCLPDHTDIERMLRRLPLPVVCADSVRTPTSQTPDATGKPFNLGAFIVGSVITTTIVLALALCVMVVIRSFV